VIANAGTLRALLAEAARTLAGAQARLEAELLLAHALEQPRSWLYAHADQDLGAVAAQQFRELVAARRAGRPIAYLTGKREFWSLDLRVSPDVLIPRPETELLVELALRRIVQSSIIDVADLGTGSGAIALALAQERERARVLATDVSAAALEIARANAQRLGLDNVEFALGDWCAALGSRRFDLIVSNPPYIAAADPHLRQGDLRFEPRVALTSGTDGLDAIRKIVCDAHAHLKTGGWLLLEHGHEQGAAVRALLADKQFIEITTATDLQRHERVTGGRRGG
jgi:release factor glutamine methyltransferase